MNTDTEITTELEYDADLSGLDNLLDQIDPPGEDEDSELEGSGPVGEPEDPYATQMRLMEERREADTAIALKEKGISKEIIEQMKAKYGSIYTFMPSDKDLYLWRPCMKREWDAIQSRLQTTDHREEKIMKAVVNRCVVHPMLSDSLLDKTRAGFLDTMFNVILMGSYFYTPEQAMSYVIEL